MGSWPSFLPWPLPPRPLHRLSRRTNGSGTRRRPAAWSATSSSPSPSGGTTAGRAARWCARSARARSCGRTACATFASTHTRPKCSTPNKLSNASSSGLQSRGPTLPPPLRHAPCRPRGRLVPPRRRSVRRVHCWVLARLHRCTCCACRHLRSAVLSRRCSYAQVGRASHSTSFPRTNGGSWATLARRQSTPAHEAHAWEAAAVKDWT
mmetsp:Transcript_11415/g.46250  ORF Transcript_11415/g.46250 Transcript_11415/m.46250 type:complete len:208 (-) Transcript_11415:105-728(-)